MTVTITLVQDIIKVNPCIKFRDHIKQTHTQTDTQMDQTVFITSTADAGGNENAPALMRFPCPHCRVRLAKSSYVTHTFVAFVIMLTFRTLTFTCFDVCQL